MKSGILLLIVAVGFAAAAKAQLPVPHAPLAQRIRHTSLENVTPGHSHGSQGFRKRQQLGPPSGLDVNFNFINRCQMLPGGGVAEHFHNTVEEMFTILNGSAEFTI